MVRALRFQKVISTIRLGPDKGCGSAREKSFPSKEEEMQMHAVCSEIIRTPVRLEWKGQCWRWMENGAEKMGRGWSGKKADIAGGSLGSGPWKGGDSAYIFWTTQFIDIPFLLIYQVKRGGLPWLAAWRTPEKPTYLWQWVRWVSLVTRMCMSAWDIFLLAAPRGALGWNVQVDGIPSVPQGFFFHLRIHWVCIRGGMFHIEQMLIEPLLCSKCCYVLEDFSKFQIDGDCSRKQEAK